MSYTEEQIAGMKGFSSVAEMNAATNGGKDDWWEAYQNKKNAEDSKITNNNETTKGQAAPKSQRRGGVLRYPLEALTGTTDYLQINIIEYKRQPNQLTRPAGFGANTFRH